MAVLPVDKNALQDKLNDFADKYNTTIDEIITVVSQSGDTVTLTKHGGGTFTINLPAGTDKVLTGLMVTLGGSGPYTADYTAGTYQISGTNYTIGSGSLPISDAHPTLDRIDVVIMDDTSTASILAGTPAADPISPTVTSGQLAVAYIHIPAASPPIVVPPALWSASNLDPGVLDGQTLRWNQASSRWARNNWFLSTMSQMNGQAISTISFGRTGTGTDGASALTMTASNFALYHLNGTGTYSAKINFDVAGQRVHIQSTGSTQTVLDIDLDGGIKIKNATPTVATNKLYNVAGTLYWNGSPLGFAVTKATVSIDDTNSPYAADPDTEAAIICSAGSGDITVVLPFAPGTGDEIEIRTNNVANPYTAVSIDRNGELIDGLPLNIDLPNGAGVKLRYAVGSWYIIAAQNKSRYFFLQASTDATSGSPFQIPAAFFDAFISIYADADGYLELPPTPVEGQIVTVKIYSGSNDIYVSGNGYDIDSDTPFVWSGEGSMVSFRFSTSNARWEIF